MPDFCDLCEAELISDVELEEGLCFACMTLRETGYGVELDI